MILSKNNNLSKIYEKYGHSLIQKEHMIEVK